MGQRQNSTAGTLYTISAPSGAGKTSLVRALLDSVDGLTLSVSHTTRPRREGETDGVDYHFVDEATFDRMVAERAFLEHARVFDNQYGTSRHGVDEQLNAGRDVLLEIDWQGARQVRSAVAGAVSIFVLPPSREALKERLTDRGQDAEAVIARRMAAAIEEMSHYGEADYLVINDRFDDAVRDLAAIVQAGRVRRELQIRRWKSLIDALLAPAQPVK